MTGGCDLLFLQWDHDSGALQDYDLLFLPRDRSSDGLQQQDLLLPNVHALCIGDLLFIISNIRHQLEWQDRFIAEAAA
jgi:hypothetical protein